MVVVKAPRVDLARLLLERGADLSARDRDANHGAHVRRHGRVRPAPA